MSSPPLNVKGPTSAGDDELTAIQSTSNPELQPLIPRSPRQSSAEAEGLVGTICRTLGFKKRFDFWFWLIFGGTLLAFSLLRMRYLSPASLKENAAPGEWFWLNRGLYKWGIRIHLGAILPCGLLAVLQFIPAIRHKYVNLHRLNGYAVLILLYIGMVGALMVTRPAFGGSISTQSGLGLLALATSTSAALAYYNIRRLQIDQHRKWMLRSMFTLASIITLRIIHIISSLILSSIGGYYTLWRCDELAFLMDDAPRFATEFPGCRTHPPNVPVAVLAQWNSIEQFGSALRLTFGASLWLALFIHLVGVEVYLSLTPTESERLRKISYQRQLEAGFKRPGSCGLTADKLGDAAPWNPK